MYMLHWLTFCHSVASSEEFAAGCWDPRQNYNDIKNFKIAVFPTVGNFYVHLLETTGEGPRKLFIIVKLILQYGCY